MTTNNSISFKTTEELNNMFVAELRDLCKAYGIPRYSDANKVTLIEMIESFYEENNAADDDSEELTDLNMTVTNDTDTSNVYISITTGSRHYAEPVCGKTIAEMKAFLSQALNFDINANVAVNGDEVNNNYIIKPGDEIEIVHRSGTKG